MTDQTASVIPEPNTSQFANFVQRLRRYLSVQSETITCLDMSPQDRAWLEMGMPPKRIKTTEALDGHKANIPVR